MDERQIMAQVLAIVTKKLVTEDVYDETIKQLFESIKGKAPKVHRHTADDVDDSTTKRVPTIAKQDEWDKKVSEERLTAAIAAFAGGLAWKGVFTTLEELKSKITDPKEGYFVIVTQEPTFQNKNTPLIYEAESVNDWQSLPSLLLPGVATESEDGLMSKGDKKKLNQLQNYTLPVATEGTLGGVKSKAGNAITIDVGGVISIPEDRTVKSGEREKWNKAVSDATGAASAVAALQGTVTSNTTKITELEGKFTYLTKEEAQAIIDKYKEA